MKRLLFLGALFLTISSRAQDVSKSTVYWPNERVTEILDNTQYFIYNTTRTTDKDYSWFVYSNGSELRTTNASPEIFFTTEEKYLFTTEKPKISESDTHWYLKCLHGYIDHKGLTNKVEPSNSYVTPWANDDKISRATVESEGVDGIVTNPLETKVWTITNIAGKNTSADKGYAWSGVAAKNDAWSEDANIGDAWISYSTAQPYAFYTVSSKIIDNRVIQAFRERIYRIGLFNDIAFNLQKLYGLVREGSKYFSNYPETKPTENSSYDNLIDGDDNSIFHSSWSAGGGENDPKHFLRAELLEAKSEFYFITKRRTNSNYNRPTSILIEGSNEADGVYTEIATVENLPTDANEYFYFSDKISTTTAYKYIRFTPQGMQKNGKNTRYFTYSEFYVIEANAETESEIKKVKNLYENESGIKDENVEDVILPLYESVLGVQESLKLKSEAKDLLIQNAENHANDPALGQYPTKAYNALKTVADDSNTTSVELTTAIKTFKFSINAPVFTINGAFRGSYQTVGKSIYYKAGDNAKPLWWNKETNKYDKTMLWKFAGSTNTTAEVGQTYTVMNLAEDVYFWNIEQINVKATNPTNEDGIVLINTVGNDTPIHASKGGSIVRWKDTTPTGASAWTITYVGESFDIDQIDEENLKAYAELKTLVPECEPFERKIGTGLNQFSCSGHDFVAVLTNAKKIIAQDIFKNPELDAVSALTELRSAKAALTINQPKPGKFYRIKSVSSNKYVASNGIAGANQKMQENGTDISSVFYLSENGYLTGSNLLNMTKASSTGSALGDTYAFLIHTQGYYMIKPSSSNPLYDNSAESGTLEYWGNNPDEEPKCAWMLEEVTDESQQLKFTKIMTTKNATLGVPVALNIPQGIKAYTVTVSEDKNTAMLIEIVGGIIPAGCGVVLEKTDDRSEYVFTFSPKVGTVENNALEPLYIETTVDSDVNAYILADKEKGLGFYQLSPDDRTISANKAYLELPASVNHVRLIAIDNPNTSIEGIVENNNKPQKYYDLQGRCVLNPTKGIYVTEDGKKVLFNK